MLSNFTIQAQTSVALGARTGVSLFTIANENLEDQKYLTSFTFSVPVEIGITPMFSVQPELNYNEKGVAFEDELTDIVTSTRTSYLEMPILAKGTFGTGSVQFNAFAGPSFGFGIDRRQVVNASGYDSDVEELTISIVSTDLDFDDEGDIQDNRFELGAVMGLGFTYGTNVKFVFDARYNLDLNDNLKIDGDEPADYEKSFNRGMSFTAGVMVPLK